MGYPRPRHDRFEPPRQSRSTPEEPYIDSPVIDAIHLARRLQAGADEQAAKFSPLYTFLMTLMDSAGGRLIKYPG